MDNGRNGAKTLAVVDGSTEKSMAAPLQSARRALDAGTPAGRTPGSPGDVSRPTHLAARESMRRWLVETRQNVYLTNQDFQHTARLYLGTDFARLDPELTQFGALVATELEPLVAENDLRFHFPRIEQYSGIGERDDRIVHHPTYEAAGDIIYGTHIVERLTRHGGLCEGMSFLFLSSHAGEAGHNCPLVCGYELARLLEKLPDFPERKTYLAKLLVPSYRDNFTASQFLTEVQGGSDVGINSLLAMQNDKGEWSVRGEKWFCSNADAELQVVSARYDPDLPGTQGLGLFLVPARGPDGSRNSFTFRRLKEKLGTRALATAEIDYHNAYAIALGPVDHGFKTLIEEVIHHSRMALALGMFGNATRAYQLARAYADTRSAFGQRVIEYPLVQENLAHLRVQIAAPLAGTFAILKMQDDLDTGRDSRAERRHFIRLMANIGKHLASRWVVDACLRAMDTLAGNGTIETFSSIPRLFRDVVIEKNWEGTHNTLFMQILRDLHKLNIDQAYAIIFREELALLPDETEKSALGSELEELLARVHRLKKLDSRLQTLEVSHVAERMGALFYYLKLLWEAHDQAKTTGRTTKRACAAFFRATALASHRPPVDHAYLQLLSEVVEIAPSET